MGFAFAHREDRSLRPVRRSLRFCYSAGFANGFMSLTADTTLMFFSTKLEESSGDDIRYDSGHWDIWDVIER